MNIDFQKSGGLVPSIVQDYRDGQVLMLGYMNSEALQKTISEKRVTLYSRSRGELWTKGETSGNYLEVKEISTDCDRDTILIRVVPTGPVCHHGTDTCFGNKSARGFLYTLEDLITSRLSTGDEKSYTVRLFRQGINRMVQKVGEEAVELIIEAKDNNADLLKQETADLLYHLLVLLKARGVSLEEIEEVLRSRDASKNK
jgi:phosphoribosyl-ATP pyrophosphohydrolase/phosphoribosyl-AMP cyclohydrolase